MDQVGDCATLDMERKDTASTLESPFGSKLNTPVDERFQNLDGMLRIRSSDFTDSEMQETERENEDQKVQRKGYTQVHDQQEAAMDDFRTDARTPEGITRSDSSSPTTLTTAAVVDEILTFDSPSNNIEYAASLILKTILFFPWCALVGATILLCPEYLEQIAFRTGYVSSPSGILRFAHWSEFAGAHILSFLILVCSLFWFDIFFGSFVLSVLLGRIVRTWNEVQINTDIPLGEDDQQTIYILATKFFFNGYAMDLDLLKAGSNYYAKREGMVAGVQIEDGFKED